MATIIMPNFLNMILGNEINSSIAQACRGYNLNELEKRFYIFEIAISQYNVMTQMRSGELLPQMWKKNSAAKHKELRCALVLDINAKD
uniref:Uncharacterized protein n=1 Tax=Romanomermis culicivorax TaxID=13658 RepID=A0A915HJV7_ROMCU